MHPPLMRAIRSRLKLRWSPTQISETLRREFSDDMRMHVSAETIYQAIYVQGRGELRRELARCLRTGRAVRKPQRRGDARRPRFFDDALLISQRPAEAEDRAVPGHWESQWCCQAASVRAGGCSVKSRLSRSRAQRTSIRRRASAMTAWVWVRPCSRFLR